MLDRCNTYRQLGLWIRAAYMTGFQNQSITAVVRDGDRVTPQDFKFLPEGIDLPVRFIRKTGDALRGLEAELYLDDGTTVRRTEVIVKPICELTAEDLRGTTPELVRYHLALVNDTLLPSPESFVTIWRFVYCPKATE